MVNPLANYGMMMAASNPWDKGPMEAAKAYIEQSNQAQEGDALAKIFQGDMSGIGALSPNNAIKIYENEQRRKATTELAKAYGISPDIAAAMATAPSEIQGAIFQNATGMMSPYQEETLDIRRTELENRRAAAEEAAAARAEAAETRRALKLNTDTEKLSNNLDKQGVPELGEALAAVEDALAPYKGKDVPGYGLTGQLPDLLVGEEANLLRQKVSRVGNAILKARSGGAVTPQEATRLLKELGINETANGITLEARADEQLFAGMEMVGDTLRERIKNIRGGYSPDVIEEYQGRGGSGFDYEKRGSKKTAPASNGISEGATATNPTTGAKIIFRGGQWQPM